VVLPGSVPDIHALNASHANTFRRCVTLQVSQQSRHFIAEVVGDDLLQKEGGQALWQSIKYALEPGVIR
jgi:hypothetical protein